MAFDGDGIGRRIELYLLENREEDVQAFSARILAAIGAIGQILESRGGELIFCTGDSVLAKFSPNTKVNNLIEECERIFLERTGNTIASGAASTLREVYLELKLAKGRKTCPP